MVCWFKNFFVFLIVFTQSFLFANEYEEKLIEHVKQSIALAEKGVSKLTSDVLAIEGMSSSKVRHLLNNLCSLPNIGYLEIGTWFGSTWVSALYKNCPQMSFAIAIDDWSQFGGTKKKFQTNCNKFLKNYSYQFIESDCFNLNIHSIFQAPVDVYFYDGDHKALSQQLAFEYYDSIFNDVFIAVVDDWNCLDAQKGTRLAFERLRYKILFEKHLPAHFNGDRANWWNGLYVAVIRKP